MICNCGGMMRQSTWETVDGVKHHREACPGCGRVFNWPDVVGDSSNGKTSAFDADNSGSIPGSPAMSWGKSP